MAKKSSLIVLAAKDFLGTRKHVLEGTENVSAEDLTQVWKKYRDTEYYSNYDEEGWNGPQFYEFREEFGDRASNMLTLAECFDRFLIDMV